ncbi:NAD(P)H-hydrate epimerase / ADP-dependent (S)-NAD(P)H-hydrate dehydratase [hydrothermal vent metagenome]|uniref:Nicotinamide nucleotide repair protein n=1 Tax=hydrothermal vent metagenome TaxID=652676 RepID=A0A3B0YYW6_9ZZZZ
MIARMSLLPHTLYRAAAVRELERIAIEAFSIPGIELMTRAGEAAFAALSSRWPQARRIAVICGGGNNGGDGFVIARLAQVAGLEVSVALLVDVNSLQGDARLAYEAMVTVDIEVQPMSDHLLANADVIVDAMLGTGLNRHVAGRWRDAIVALNAASAPVLTIDIPSGLNADSGTAMGVAVQAEVTISFIGLKQGMLTADGPECCGDILFDDLEVPQMAYEKVAPAASRIDSERLSGLLPRRVRSAHKGDCGHVLLIGGAPGMSGAIQLAGEAALRCGAGRVSIATASEHAAILNQSRPELMVHAVADAAALRLLMNSADVIAIGPGLSTSTWGMAMLDTVLTSDAPLVVDADALNLLAVEPFMRDDWVLTPHPGEAARLLNMSTSQIQVDRFCAIDALQRQYGGVVVLKGAGTLVVDQDGTVSLCDVGNPGMASGGMGDVLTGVISGLIAQGLNLSDAARCGVWLHASAADRAALAGERGLLASDLMPHLRALVNGL